MSVRPPGECTAPDRRCILVIATVASFLTPFMSSSINIALPVIGAEFATDAVLLGWIQTAYLLASAICLVPFGRLADIHGMKKIFLTGITIFTLSTLLCGLSPTVNALIALRMVQGVGTAMIAVTAVAVLTAVFPAGERGRVLGINVAAVYTGLSMGPFLGGVLTQHLGWRSIFLVTVPLGLIAVALTLRARGEWSTPRDERFDLIGSVVYGTTLLALMYGLTLLPEATGFGLIAVGVVGIFLFLWQESHTESPVLQVRLFFENHVFTFSNIAALINYSATFAVSFLLSLYLQYNRGLDPQAAGLILLAQPVVQALISPAAGRLSDRVEPRIVSSVGMTLSAAGLALLTVLTEETPVPYILISLVVLGTGYALFSSPNTNAIMSSVEKRYYGVASATLATSRQVGMMLSMGIVMMIFSVVIGRVAITPAEHAPLLSSINLAFMLFAALCVVGIFFSLARGRVREDPHRA
ncbi:MFS transporter [Methanofollis formosanus]|uniref:MFS transporter n=1 Tax=Methanofollis formosanus TaxID=299308 RepID=A0A8G1A4A3_9EURY|nr:MFS transporter [Methanofollis formosanus]QYZ80320.1 MFS transporter [Methanofollis formosanus]